MELRMAFPRFSYTGCWDVGVERSEAIMGGIKRGLGGILITLGLLLNTVPALAEGASLDSSWPPKGDPNVSCPTGSSACMDEAGAGANVDTVFVLDRPVPLKRIASSLGTSSLKVRSLEHTGDSRGSFFPGSLGWETALEKYRSWWRGAAPRTSDEPRIFSFRIAGPVSPESLGEIAATIAAVEQVPAAEQSIAFPIRSSTPTTSDTVPTSSVSEDTSNSDPPSWVPAQGVLEGYESASGARVIHNTMRWSTQADLQSFGETAAYEHNLQLFNYDIPDAGLHGDWTTTLCPGDDFWAQRSDAMLLDTTYPDQAGPYLDTNFHDPCTVMDMTVGVRRPQFLTGGVEYQTTIIAEGGPSAQASLFDLASQKPQRNCDIPLIHVTVLSGAACIGLNLPVLEEASGYFPIIPDAMDCELPGLYPWTKDSLPPDCVPSASPPCEAPGTAIASISTGGRRGDAASVTGYYDRSISSDGRFIAFHSLASTLAEGDENETYDIFVHDRLLGVTRLVSRNSEGELGNGQSLFPSISDDGRYVAFQSDASNLVPDDSNGVSDIFLRDVQEGTIQRVSVSILGVEGNRPSHNAAISGDGSSVAFVSEASNLVPTDLNAAKDVFLHRVGLSFTQLVSANGYGLPGNGDSHYPSVSDDGRFVAFDSRATDLVEGDTNYSRDVFVRDMQDGLTTRQSVTATGEQSWHERDSEEPMISGDGRFVVFQSGDAGLVDGDVGSWYDIFLRDRTTGSIALVSVSSSGEQAANGSFSASVSADDQTVVFESRAANLVPGDANEYTDVFSRDIGTGITQRISSAIDGGDADMESAGASLSSDGGSVAFFSHATNLVCNDFNGRPDVFVAPINI